MTQKRTPGLRLRTLLLLVNFVVLIVPIGGIYAFRLYENELVHQTETELIVQGAFITSMYKKALLEHVPKNASYGTKVSLPPSMDEKYNPILPVLNLSQNAILPPRPDSVDIPATDADKTAQEAGKAIAPVLEEASLVSLAGIRVVDDKGVVVAGREEMGHSLAHVEEVQGALKGHYSAALRQRISKHDTPPLASISRGADIRVFIALPVLDNDRVLGAVLLSRAPRDVMKALYEERSSVLTVLGIVIAITVLLAWLTSYAISRPIHALIAQAQRVACGDKDISPISEPVTQELALLSQNIASMANTISERSDYIRNFAMHVSHEFKTPLTAIQGAIELIQEHGASMPPEQLQKFLANTMKDTERLRQLVTRLLELARADMLQPSAGTCQFADLAKELHSDMRDKGLTLNIRGGEHVTLPMPHDIAYMVFGNLLDNSRQHGATQVNIAVQQTEKKLLITVFDNGKGISPANAEKLFTPFFTTRRGQGGTGLGLVIVRSLLASCKAAIRIVPQGQGACFEISVTKGNPNV